MTNANAVKTPARIHFLKFLGVPDDSRLALTATPVANLRAESDASSALLTGLDAPERGDDSTGTAPATRAEPESRFNRSRSARISAALWHRSFGSFSSALLISSSSFGGKSGFNRAAETGARFKIASNITADVSPRNGNDPVAIS